MAKQYLKSAVLRHGENKLQGSGANGPEVEKKLKGGVPVYEKIFQAISVYLKDLSRYALLSSEEEINLARRIEGWCSLKMILSSDAFENEIASQVDRTSFNDPASTGEYILTELASLQDSCDQLHKILLPLLSTTTTLYTLRLNGEFKEALDNPNSEKTFKKFTEIRKCEYATALETVAKISSLSLLIPIKVVEILGPHTAIKDLPKRLQEVKIAGEFAKLRGLFADHFKHISVLGVESRDAMCESNLRLVVSIAKRYQGRGLSLGDMIQEGNIGLLHAIEKYNYRLGYKFSTYATWWVRQSIVRALSTQARDIRIPVTMIEIMSKVRKTRLRFVQEYGREPTPEEYTEVIGVPSWRIGESIKFLKDSLSLDMIKGENAYSAMKDSIPDESLPLPEEVAAKLALLNDIREVIATLTRRERDVIKLRYGIDTGKERTLKEVGIELGLTRERIRQIENVALKKLLHPTRVRALHDYLY